MNKVLGLALVVTLALGCSNKKRDRDTECRAGKDTFVAGMKQQIADLDKAGDTETADGYRQMLETSEPKFMAYCQAASEADLDCIEHIQTRMNDAACKSAIDRVKTQLFGL